jgi:adenylylsulfate kinase-like enzyme
MVAFRRSRRLIIIIISMLLGSSSSSTESSSDSLVADSDDASGGGGGGRDGGREVPEAKRMRREGAVAPDDSFDYARSTEENHAAASAEDGAFVGEFKAHRSTLDYSYHRRYAAKRQLLQDEIVRRMLRTVVQDAHTHFFCERPVQPWVVFTAGAMGAGKSRCMKWVSQKGYFPLASFVQVDPDVIRYELPEMEGYLERDRTAAGSQTHKEAGFIQEILTLEGLRLGKNVIVDGSLHDADWNSLFFARIRKEHPNVKIAIVHVSCDPSEVLRRAARRAETTGRVVPREKLLRTAEQVPRSVARLSPLTDYTINLNTDGPEPAVGSPPGETWVSFARQWAQECQDDEAVPSLKLLKGFGGSSWDEGHPSTEAEADGGGGGASRTLSSSASSAAAASSSLSSSSSSSSSSPEQQQQQGKHGVPPHIERHGQLRESDDGEAPGVVVIGTSGVVDTVRKKQAAPGF